MLKQTAIEDALIVTENLSAQSLRRNLDRLADANRITRTTVNEIFKHQWADIEQAIQDNRAVPQLNSYNDLILEEFR
jgi:hypothetical protein